MVSSFFVYGTLKRGQYREHCWPVAPLSVRPAWTGGCLFSRVDYPAMTSGDDRVLGELWTFADQHVAQVVARLDQIEGTNQPRQPDLYRREVVCVFDLGDVPLGQAFAYLYETEPEIDGFTRVVGMSIHWPKPSTT